MKDTIIPLLDEEDLEAIEEENHEYLNNVGANYYNNGEYGIARIYYELASSLGNVTALSNLGYIYMYGREVPVDYSIALAYFSVAAKRGDIEATYKLGNLYQAGKGVEKNIEKAIEYYDKALELLENNEDIDNMVYPSIYYTLAKELMPGGHKDTNLEKAYEYLKIAVQGYNYLIEIEGANHYKNICKVAEETLKDSIFDEFKNNE